MGFLSVGGPIENRTKCSRIRGFDAVNESQIPWNLLTKRSDSMVMPNSKA